MSFHINHKFTEFEISDNFRIKLTSKADKYTPPLKPNLLLIFQHYLLENVENSPENKSFY